MSDAVTKSGASDGGGAPPVATGSRDLLQWEVGLQHRQHRLLMLFIVRKKQGS